MEIYAYTYLYSLIENLYYFHRFFNHWSIHSSILQISPRNLLIRYKYFVIISYNARFDTIYTVLVRKKINQNYESIGKRFLTGGVWRNITGEKPRVKTIPDRVYFSVFTDTLHTRINSR